MDEINDTGGINGRKIELIERDDEAKNEVGAKIADELTRQKVVATIGIVNTGVGLASIDACQKAKIPLMIAVSTGTSLTRKYAPPAAPFQQQAKQAGLEVVAGERFKIGDQDMCAQVKRAKAAGAESLIVWGIGPELAVIARNKDAAGWKVPMLGSWTFSMRNFIDGSGRAGEGALMP